MNREACAAGVHGFLKHGGAPVLLRKLRESNRRRVLLDPPSEIIETRLVGQNLAY